MLEPDDLIDLPQPDDGEAVPTGLPLIAGLTGFSDAGGTVAQLDTFLRERLSHRVVARFDADQLLDYRARRPVFTFENDHLTAVEPPRLELLLLRDELERPFLFLTGFEPDFQWERFTAAVLRLTERLGVESTTWVHAIPMPVPHTRPIGMTVSGTRDELVEAFSVWRPTTRIPGTALHLLEYRLAKRDRAVAGFALLVPHYLSDTEHPGATLAAVESIAAATGLILPTDDLRERLRDYLGKVDAQVGENDELQRLVNALEEQYDDYMAGNPARTSLADDADDLPSGDELGAELERFLSSHRRGDGEAD